MDLVECRTAGTRRVVGSGIFISQTCFADEGPICNHLKHCSKLAGSVLPSVTSNYNGALVDHLLR